MSTTQALDELMDLKSGAMAVATMAAAAFERVRGGDPAGALAALDELDEQQADLRFAFSQARLSLRRLVEGGQS